jgi:hypothetical protein
VETSGSSVDVMVRKPFLSFRDAPLGAGPESILMIVVMDSGLTHFVRAPE